jgi:S-DNA-T family DNA segregation ATPase FtsK/SpoIIIE
LRLLSYSNQDPAWTTSGVNGSVCATGAGDWAPGSDVGFFLLGFSVWWCVAAGVRAWLTGACTLDARRTADPPPRRHALARFAAGRLAFWLGLVCCWWPARRSNGRGCIVSSRLLPGHWRRRAGVPGRAGQREVAGLYRLRTGQHRCRCDRGLALVFRFSWGLWPSALVLRWTDWSLRDGKKREIAEDLELGKQAAREREAVMVVERRESVEQHR